MTPAVPPDLRPWLVSQRQLFGKAFDAGNLKDWVICVGNEAGDLDTLASSIGFAYLASYFAPAPATEGLGRQYIPVQLTAAQDFELRPENVEALRSADLLDDTLARPLPELVCADRLDLSRLPPLGARYALVDHNQIKTDVFGAQAEVVAVIDHHEPAKDNTLYPAADPRLIRVPTGSCASLVANYFAPRWPPAALPSKLADLLLSAISIDTANFKPQALGGKATEADTQAKQWLLARSRFYLAPIPEHSADRLAAAGGAMPDVDAQLDELHKHLSELKNDVSRLSASQLLLRDYKKYDQHGWVLGLSSVPLSLAQMVDDKAGHHWTALLDVVRTHGLSKGLDAVGVQTSFKLSKKDALASGQPRHGRELLLVALNSRIAPILERLEPTDQQRGSAEALVLTSHPVPQEQLAAVEQWLTDKAVQLRIWNIGNPSATRKLVAPTLTRLIDALGPK